MLNEYLLEFSNAIWKDTDLAQLGGVIFKAPVGCIVQRSRSASWSTSRRSCFPGDRTTSFPSSRSTQYAADGPPASAANIAIIFV